MAAGKEKVMVVQNASGGIGYIRWTHRRDMMTRSVRIPHLGREHLQRVKFSYKETPDWIDMYMSGQMVR